ncbi:MFS transporter [Aliikangiella coralliicola]|uniref:MFS transporter n=1 Tax=Aliikangiella coralliicola TaxID=2592383 RepID=A0A545U4G9_9GAMM|nr:MFS transporter [Aliikangiella coralliicola]TQV84368.1 MFS transporter [Aliikangiella coralliicola]
MQQHSTSRLFSACCFALIVTAMTFAIRAGILTQLGKDFLLSDSQLGWINAMAFLGFPIATILGGLLYNSLGAKKLLVIAFSCHLFGLVFTIFAGGFWTLLISTFFIGFANGAVEAGANPLIANIYHQQKTTMLNRFHVWFPGGIVIGAIASKLMTDAGWNWQAQIAIMLLPALVYGVMVLRQNFPQPVAHQNQLETSTATNAKALLSPLFLLMVACMTLTATTELGTQQWIERILGASGASPMLILALITGLMAVGRYFAGGLIRRFNSVGVLFYSAIIATLGIYAMSQSTGVFVYFSAVLFALGVTYFWPTMLGFVAETIPQSGALGLSVLGGAGMFAVSLWNPVIGSWIDNARENISAVTNSGVQTELLVGQQVLSNLVLFPLVLILCFGLLYWFQSKKNSLVIATEKG